MKSVLLLFFICSSIFTLSAQYTKKINDVAALTNRSAAAVDLYHEGLRFKNGIDTPVDYNKAFHYFKMAADLGDAQSRYAEGYCYYKGLGVAQNYLTAAVLFAEGAREGRDNSMYFYGLCFENGYGLTRNADSAMFWLGKAAVLGYRQAIEELKSPKGENANDSALALLDKISRSGLGENEPLNEFTLVQPHIPSKALIRGTYNGYVLRYDWSGKFLISSKAIRLTLRERKENSAETDGIAGTWEEQGDVAIPLQALLSEDSVIFQQTHYKIHDHYSWQKPITYNFTSASLNLRQIGDSVYLSGNIEMFSPERDEPSKPIYLALVRSDAIAGTLRDSILSTKDKDLSNSTGIAEIKGAKLYPNPFSTSFITEFILTEEARVAIQLLNMNGVIVYKKPKEQLHKGKYSINISPGKIAPGMYILRLIMDNGNYADLKAIRK